MRPAAQHRHAARDLLDLGEHVRGEEDAAPVRDDLAQDRLDLVLDERIEAVRRLVEHDQLRLRHERDCQADLLAVAARERPDAPARIEPQPLDQLPAVAGVDVATQRGHEIEAGVDAQRVVELEVAREVAAAAAHLERVALGVEAEHLGAAGAGADQVHEDADRGGLAGAVGAEETEDLAARHGQVDAIERAHVAVRLDEALKADRRAVAHPSTLRAGAIQRSGRGRRHLRSPPGSGLRHSGSLRHSGCPLRHSGESRNPGGSSAGAVGGDASQPYRISRYRSRQTGFSSSINSSFQARFHSFSRLSRTMALSIVSWRSNQTSRCVR